MDARSPLNQYLALIVAGVMFLNPIVATAAQVTVDAAAKAGTTVGAAGNGVPIVNIARPNGSGLSSNTFRDYNVGKQGLILNNATNKTQSTQLGGIIVGNPNLKGQAAKVILNQVTGGNRSTLAGYTEVAGSAARVIVANPHGITCNGCGFINTPRTTLTTGKPIMDGERLDRFQVDGGDIALEGAGLNASNVEQFDLITRSAKLNATLHAQQLNIVTGRNDVKADSLQVTPRADDGSGKPLLAIDSSALGGMYAGAIRLVGTEKGVGVKLAGNMASTASDVQIDVNGKLSLGNVTAERDLKIAAHQVELEGKTYAARNAEIRSAEQLVNRQSLAARERIDVAARQIDNRGVIEAGVEANNTRNNRGDLHLASQDLRNSASVVASRQLEVTARANLDNQGGSLKGATTTVTAGKLDNRQGQVLASHTLTLKADTLDNRDKGLLHSQRSTVVQANSGLNNQGGRVIGLDSLAIDAPQLDNSNAGLLASNRQVVIQSHALNNQAGEVSGARNEVRSASVNNQGGKLLGGDVLLIASAAIDNRLGLISASQHLDIQGLGLNNSNKGALLSQGTLNTRISGLLDNRNQGNVVSEGALQVTAGQLNNSGSGLLSSKATLTLSGERLDNRGGVLVADQGLTVVGDTLDNSGGGKASTQADLVVDVGTLRNHDAGKLLGQGRVTLDAKHIDNQRAGQIVGNDAVTITTHDLLNQQGVVSSIGTVGIAATGQLDNTSGKIIGDSGLTLTVQRLLNQSKGLLAGRDGVVLRGAELLNSDAGRVSSLASVDIELSGTLDNSVGGELVSEGRLSLSAAQLDNHNKGLVSAIDTLNVVSHGALNNQGGTLVTDAALSIRSANLDNRHGGAISAVGALELRSGGLDNRDKGRIGSDTGITLHGAQLYNGEQGRITSRGKIEATLSGLDQRDGGYLFSATGISLDLQGGTLFNRDKGVIASPGQLLLRQIGALDNSAGGEISSDLGYSLHTDRLDNQGGRLISADSLILRIANALDNSRNGVLSAGAGLDIEAGSLSNTHGGTLASRGDIGLTLEGLLANQHQGTLSAGGNLRLNSGVFDNSDQGLVSANLGLHIDTGTLDNSQGGQLISQGDARIDSTTLDNRSGAITSAKALLLNSTDLRNGAYANALPGGRISSDANLTITARHLDNGPRGELSAKGDLRLSVQRLIQQQGRLIGEQAVHLNLQGGTLDNQGGLIHARGPLTFEHLGLVDNSNGGEISSEQAFSLLATQLDNQHKGRLISAGTLQVEATSIDNSNAGLVSGLQGLEVRGTTLDNRGAGTLSSQHGRLDVHLEDTLDNRDQGALVSLGRQQITATRLDNRHGIIAGEADVTLSIDGRLDNSQGGLIAATQTLSLNRTSSVIDNSGGQLNGQRLEIDGKQLNNQNGQVTSQGALRVTLLGALLNTQGARLASGGDLLLNSANLDNRGGRLVSQALLRIDADSLNNSAGGTLASQQNLVLRLKGDLLNQQDGLVFSERGSLDIQAQALDNQAASLKAQGNILLRLGDDLRNQGGRVDSVAGNLDIHSTHLNNSAGGMLNSSQGRLTLVSGLLDNNAGTLQAQTLDLEARDGLHNRKGFISALSGDNRIATATFDNQGGGLYAAGWLGVNAGQFLNQAGKVGAGRIDFDLSGLLDNQLGQLESEADLALRSQTLNNANGSLRALGRSGTTLISTRETFNNNAGLLETANQHLDLQVAGLSNNSGQLLHTGSGNFGLAADKVMRAGGLLYTNGLLDIKAANWTNSSVLQAARLNLDIGQFTQTASGKLLAAQSFTGKGVNWRNDGLLASDGSLRLDLTGTYNGTGRTTSLGNLTLNAASIDLASTSTLTGGATSVVSATNTLTNRGRITSAGNLTATAGTLDNYATLGSATALRINADTLRNNRGLIFSGNDMTLRVGTFTNTYADLYSLGGLSIARDDRGTRATHVENISGSLESAGNMSLLADTLINRKDKLTVRTERVSGSINTYADDHCKGKGCEFQFTAVEISHDVIDQDSQAASITTGGSLTFSGNEFSNRYSSVSAARNISIDTAVLNNIGVSGGEQRNLNGSFYSRNRSHYSGFMQKKNAFNQSGVPGMETLDQFLAAGGYPGKGVYRLSDNRTPIAGAVVSPAVIQAAGAVTINATERIDNSVVRANASGVGGIGQRGANADKATAQTSVRAVTSQLPPDLAQRQVNPVTLPSFSLPQGEHGLFRLSGQTGQTAQASGALAAGADLTQHGQAGTLGSLANTATGNDGQGHWAGPDAQAASVAGQTGTGLDGLPAGVKLVQGVPTPATASQPHKYLVETNPVLTDLKKFLSSDYLLGSLDIDPDATKKRLGDGLYEQRLIREAVVERTGQRLIAGLDSDEAMFRYLMDNAIASKDALSLSVGVSLSAEQVAALTHDIVWMETIEVNGEQVLAPVLYLAQSEGRLAPNGALIQGRDVSLISGGELNNVGTLRASNNLSVTAGNIDNSGLMEAGQRLDLLATDSIRNSAGGILKGRDVSLLALTGDVINERSVTRLDDRVGGEHVVQNIVNNAARIEAANDLTLSAGRDIGFVGGVATAGGNIALSAERDLYIASQQVTDSHEYQRRRVSGYDSTTTQYVSQVQAGGSFSASAGQDLSVIASEIEARRDIALEAGRDVFIAAAADEDHAYSKGKKGNTKTEKQHDSVRQQAAELTAGGSLSIEAGDNLLMVASKATAGGEAYISAGNTLQLLAANDSEYSLYDMNKKGNWGSKKTQRDEVTDVKAVGSVVTSGGDLNLVSGGDQLYQGAALESGRDLTIESGGAVTFEAVKDMHQESHEKSKGDLAWTSAKGKGQTDETLRQTQMVANGELMIKAVDGLKIDIRDVDQKTVSQTIDAMVQADPKMAWLKTAEQQGDVDWRKVKELHDSWDYKHSGMGVASQLIVAILVTYITAGAASGAIAAAGTGTSMAGATAAATAGASAGWANVAGTAILSGMASNAAISTINNRGNLGLVFKDVTSSDALKGYAVSGITAGFTAGVLDDAFGVTGDNVNKVTKGFDLGKLDELAKFGTYLGAQGVVQAGAQTAVGGGSFSDNLNGALTAQGQHLLQAGVFNWVGDTSSHFGWKDGSPEKVIFHALVGGALSKATGGDFATGAAAAGASEALIAQLSERVRQDQKLELMISQLIGVGAAAAVNGDVNKGAEIAKNATAYNRQLHPEERKLISEQAKALAQEQNISVAEAERRMAEAFAYYTDKDWQTTISAAGVKFDDSTLAHLGQALAPLGANYATTDKGDVPSISDPHKVYTASETLALLKNYEINHANFYDPKVNQEYLINDRFLQNWEQLAYYDRNLNYGKTDLLGGGIGVGQGIAAAVAESAKNIYGLGEGLVTDFSGTSSRITNGLIQKASNPYEVAQAFESAKQDAKVQAFVLRLQGQEQAALRVEMQWETEFALSFAVINKAGKLGQVAKSLGERETAWKASSLADNAGGKNGPPGKNPNSTSGITDAEAGMPYAHSVGGAKGTPAWDNAISKADGDFGYLPPVRQNYVKDVYDLQGAVDKMRAGGASAEEVAKYAYGARNELKVKYREYTPPDMLDVIDARNLERYGNKIGPAFDDLVKKGKTFDQIIESSTRAGGGDLFQ